MAAIVQKNGLKTLTNGNGLVHHQMQNLNPCYDNQQLILNQNQYHNQGLQVKSEVPAELAQLPQYQEIKEQRDETSPGSIDQKHDDMAPSQDDHSVAAHDEAEPEIDIVINNVVCSFSVRCHLNLREIALNGMNVEYRKENGMITMKIRRPYTTASIWSSGKITCTGATSEDAAKQAARKFARCLQKLGFNVRFRNYRVVNVLGTCSMPFAIRINSFSERHREADYEPELHPGVTYKLQNPKATLKIFSTGSVTVTAPSVADVQAAIEHIFPLVYEFRKERTKEEMEALAKKKIKQQMLTDTEFDASTVAGDDDSDADIDEPMEGDEVEGESWGD